MEPLAVDPHKAHNLWTAQNSTMMFLYFFLYFIVKINYVSLFLSLCISLEKLIIAHPTHTVCTVAASPDSILKYENGPETKLTYSKMQFVVSKGTLPKRGIALMVIDEEWTLKYRYKEIKFWRGLRKYEIPGILHLPAWFIFKKKKKKVVQNCHW